MGIIDKEKYYGSAKTPEERVSRVVGNAADIAKKKFDNRFAAGTALATKRYPDMADKVLDRKKPPVGMPKDNPRTLGLSGTPSTLKASHRVGDFTMPKPTAKVSAPSTLRRKPGLQQKSPMTLTAPGDTNTGYGSYLAERSSPDVTNYMQKYGDNSRRIPGGSVLRNGATQSPLLSRDQFDESQKPFSYQRITDRGLESIGADGKSSFSSGWSASPKDRSVTYEGPIYPGASQWGDITEGNMGDRNAQEAGDTLRKGMDNRTSITTQGMKDAAGLEQQRISTQGQKDVANTNLQGTKYRADNPSASSKGTSNFQHKGNDEYGRTITYDPETNTEYTNNIPSPIYKPFINDIENEQYQNATSRIAKLYETDPDHANQMMSELDVGSYRKVMAMIKKMRAKK